MPLNFMFFFNNILTGIGLAMDAFSVSVANGLKEPNMKLRKMLCIAGVFAFFQALMPFLGWACVHTILSYFTFLQKIIPYIALALLTFIGSKMIFDSVKGEEIEESSSKKLGFITLMVQGIATSIDALSVGFTIAEYDLLAALLAALIIAVVTFIICLAGVFLGKGAGNLLNNKAGIIGGGILIFIGLEIFISSFLS